MENERKQVLEMLAEGKLSVEEAQQILDALNANQDECCAETMPARRRGVFRKPRMIHIEVIEDGKKKVNIHIPFSLAKFGMRFVPHDVVDVAGQKINLDEIFDAVKNGVEGNLVEVDDEDTKVRIYVD